MQSRTSFFNPGLSRNLLRRYWPIWAGWLIILLLALPSWLPSIPHGEADSGVRLSGSVCMFLSALAAMASAWAMYSFLYKNRSCHMINTLPLKRETVFFTAWLTGLAPLLLAELVTALLAALIGLPDGRVSAGTLVYWFALTALGALACYNFAVFCATLTGNTVLMPLVFLVLNFVIAVLYWAGQLLLDLTLYGYSAVFPDWVLALSPPVYLIRGVIDGFYSPEILKAVAVYAAVSLPFLALGLVFYKRRQMETAGDAVALPWLKPVFKYAFSFGFAILFGLLVFALTGADSRLALLILLLIGLFIGYFCAMMLLKRTVRVFRGHWKGFGVSAAILLVLALCVGFDLFGYETRVPAAAEVKAVSVSGMYGTDGVRFEAPENIEAAIALHEGCVALKGGQRYSAERLTIRYELQNGRTVERAYDPDGELTQGVLNALMNTPEARRSRVTMAGELALDRIYMAELSYVVESDGTTRSIELKPAEVMDLFENGILPDAEAGRIETVDHNDYGYPETVDTVEIWVYVSLKGGPANVTYLQADSTASLAWLAQHYPAALEALPADGV